ncbi:hypothetical protein ACEQPO_23160 [Bacillus sp. SL00103]
MVLLQGVLSVLQYLFLHCLVVMSYTGYAFYRVASSIGTGSTPQTHRTHIDTKGNVYIQGVSNSRNPNEFITFGFKFMAAQEDEMKWIYKYDEKFNYLPGEEIEIEEHEDLPKGYTDVRPQDGLYKGKHNEAKKSWYESATQNTLIACDQTRYHCQKWIY